MIGGGLPAEDIWSMKKQSDLIQPGDLLLIKTPGLIYKIGRKLTGNTHDHIAVCLENGNTLNIVNPRAVIIPVDYFLKRQKNPVLLRPKWQNLDQRRYFIREMEQFRGCRYNLAKTFRGIVSTGLYNWLHVRIRMKKTDESASKWICTEAVIQRLCTAYPDFKAVFNIKLDYQYLGFGTTNDFMRITREYPDLIQVIPLNPEKI